MNNLRVKKFRSHPAHCRYAMAIRESMRSYSVLGISKRYPAPRTVLR